MKQSPPVVPRESEYESDKRRVLQLIGVSVLLYQRIEALLKGTVPFLSHPDQPSGVGTWADVARQIHSKETMGPVVEKLKRSIKSSHPEHTDTYLQAVVANRNELVHTFFKLPFGALEDSESCNAAILHLKEKYAFAQPLLSALNDLASSISATLQNSSQTSPFWDQ